MDKTSVNQKLVDVIKLLPVENEARQHFASAILPILKKVLVEKFGDRLYVPPTEVTDETNTVVTAVDFIKQYAVEGRWDIVGRALQILEVDMLERMSEKLDMLTSKEIYYSMNLEVEELLSRIYIVLSINLKEAE